MVPRPSGTVPRRGRYGPPRGRRGRPPSVLPARTPSSRGLSAVTPPWPRELEPLAQFLPSGVLLGRAVPDFRPRLTSAADDHNRGRFLPVPFRQHLEPASVGRLDEEVDVVLGETRPGS